MEEFDFTDDEIRDQLETLGYVNIPTERLQQFKLDLERLVHYERSRSNSSLSTHSYAGSERAQENKKAFVEHVSVTQQGRSDEELERVMYPQPNISVYRPYERTIAHEGESRDVPCSSAAATEQRPVTKQQQLPSTSHRQENVFIRPHTAGEQLPANRKVVKRKTLRKQNGQLVVDESFESSEQDVSTSMEERMRQLRVSGGGASVRRPLSAPPGDYGRPPLSARSHFSQQGSEDGYIQSSGLIHPMSDHPHTRNVRRDDPVTRYQRYSGLWKEQQAPGEKDHRNLRWNVRGHMTHHDNVHKKNRRYFVPNNYVIPGERKHSALRWQIREELAQGYVPSPNNFL